MNKSALSIVAYTLDNSIAIQTMFILGICCCIIQMLCLTKRSKAISCVMIPERHNAQQNAQTLQPSSHLAKCSFPCVKTVQVFSMHESLCKCISLAKFLTFWRDLLNYHSVQKNIQQKYTLKEHSEIICPILAGSYMIKSANPTVSLDHMQLDTYSCLRCRVLQLHRPVFGLGQAPLQFKQEVMASIQNYGYQALLHDTQAELVAAVSMVQQVTFVDSIIMSVSIAKLLPKSKSAFSWYARQPPRNQ
jgi:hypothetical protein